MQNVSEEMSLGTLVTLLVADLHRKKMPLPFRNQEPWHQLCYALKMNTEIPGKPKFLDELVFDWDGPYPKCEELSEFLNGLHITANVSGLNPGFNFIRVKDDDAARWSSELESLDPAAKSFVSHAAQIAVQEFSQ